jgi:hypothetical protein
LNIMETRHRIFSAVVLVASVATGLAAGQPMPVAPASRAARHAPTGLPAQAADATGPIRPVDLRRWLAVLASDEMGGRGNGTEFLVKAGDYLAAEAKAIGLEPGGAGSTFFENFEVVSAKTTNRSTLTVEVNGQRRVFRHGAEVEFGTHVGGRRSFTIDQVEFIGYAIQDPTLGHDDFARKDLRGKAVVWMGGRGPAGSALSTIAVNSYIRPGAAVAAGVPVVIGLSPAAIRAEAVGRTRAPITRTSDIDFTTVGPLDGPPPTPLEVTVLQADAFYSFLLSASGVSFADLKARAGGRAPLPTFTVTGAKLTVNLDADYAVVRSSASRNVVGLFRGSDPLLAGTRLVLGAHYDHLVTGLEARPLDGVGPRPAAARAADTIFNGADDNGSGSVALLAIAKAMLAGPRPRRTVEFVWFAGEERGRLGSRYHADHGPSADRIVAMLNLDMIGRHENDDPKRSRTVNIIGSDRISTELHNLNEEANARLPEPLALDYEHNGLLNVRLHYFGSDHVTYALKGIPVIFYNTGRHQDYHHVTDSADRIDYLKAALITRLAYETAMRVSNLDHLPARDNLGVRVGKGRSGPIR